MSWKADKVWSWLDTIAGPFFPLRIRRYLTLRSITFAVILLSVWNVLLKLFLPIAPPVEIRSVLDSVVRSVMFLVPFNVTLLVGTWFLVSSKPRIEHGYLQAILSGMIMAAMLGECLILFVPWRG